MSDISRRAGWAGEGRADEFAFGSFSPIKRATVRARETVPSS
jgi:hypothetical protein